MIKCKSEKNRSLSDKKMQKQKRKRESLYSSQFGFTFSHLKKDLEKTWRRQWQIQNWRNQCNGDDCSEYVV